MGNQKNTSLGVQRTVPSPASPAGDTGRTPHGCRARRRRHQVSGPRSSSSPAFKSVAGGRGPSFRLSPQLSSPSRSRVCSPPILGGGVRFCRWSVTPLRLHFPGGVGDAEATTLQRNNFSQLLPFSDGDLLRRQ
jgi:hypothetical protein